MLFALGMANTIIITAPNPILSPKLLKVLSEMGHGDTLVIADGNFPSASIGRNGHVIRMDGHGAPEVLEAVLSVLPLDTYVLQPVHLMEVVPGGYGGDSDLGDLPDDYPRERGA